MKIEPQRIMEKRWDVLVILDGCRYDYFEKYNTIEGNLKKVKSPVTGTKAWLRRITSYDCSNIIYMTPMVKFDLWYPKHGFFKVIRLWDKNITYKYAGVDPIGIAKRAVECIKEYPDKRVIVHFFTPHPPFLTIDPEHQQKIKEESNLADKNIEKSKLKRKILFILWILKQRFPTVVFWHLERLLGVHSGMLVLFQAGGFKLIRQLYYDNLMLVFDAVKEIKDSVNKKIVVTADHGQRLGEYGMFGHGGWNSKSMVTVPWFETRGTLC